MFDGARPPAEFEEYQKLLLSWCEPAQQPAVAAGTAAVALQDQHQQQHQQAGHTTATAAEEVQADGPATAAAAAYPITTAAGRAHPDYVAVLGVCAGYAGVDAVVLNGLVRWLERQMLTVESAVLQQL